MLKSLITLFLKKEKKYIPKPVLKIKSTIVPKEFEQQFPIWDKHLFNNIKHI